MPVFFILKRTSTANPASLLKHYPAPGRMLFRLPFVCGYQWLLGMFSNLDLPGNDCMSEPQQWILALCMRSQCLLFVPLLARLAGFSAHSTRSLHSAAVAFVMAIICMCPTYHPNTSQTGVKLPEHE